MGCNPGQPISTFYAAVGRDQRVGELVLQIINSFAEPMSVEVKLNGTSKLETKARTITLANANPDTEKSLDKFNVVASQTGEFSGVAPPFSCKLSPYSLTTFRIPENP